MVERRRTNETSFAGFSPDGVNPDRVRIVEASRDSWEEVRTGSTLVGVEHAPGWSLTLAGFKNRLRFFTRAALASLALLSVAGNLGVERRTPERAGHEVVQTVTAEDFLVRVNDELN